MSLLCLGIPYIFMSRSQHQRIDEEGGVRNPGPMVMVGACACLVVSSMRVMRERCLLTTVGSLHSPRLF